MKIEINKKGINSFNSKEEYSNAVKRQGHWIKPVVLKPHMEVTPCIETNKLNLIKTG